MIELKKKIVLWSNYFSSRCSNSGYCCRFTGNGHAWTLQSQVCFCIFWTSVFLFTWVHTSPAMTWKSWWILKAGAIWKVPKQWSLWSQFPASFCQTNNLKKNPNINNMLASAELRYWCMWVYGFFTTIRHQSILIKWNLYDSSTLNCPKITHFSYWASNKQKNGFCIVCRMRISKRISGVSYPFNIKLGRQRAKVDQVTSRNKESNIGWVLKLPLPSFSSVTTTIAGMGFVLCSYESSRGICISNIVTIWISWVRCAPC